MTRRSVSYIAINTISVAVLLAVARPGHAISLGHVDTFDSGTLGWAGSPTTNVVSSLNVDSSNRVVTFNETQLPFVSPWVGNYIAAGVNRITMDVLHQNSFELVMRIGISKGPFGPNGSGDTYVTNAGVTVPNDGAWHTISFDLNPADLIPHSFNESTPPDSLAALQAVAHLRVLHNPMPGDFRGAQIPAVFRLDNITAAAIPPGENANFNGDDFVDGADFLIWQRGFGLASGLGNGDADGNGVIDGLDFAVWRRQFGETLAVATASAVPEPSAMLLLAIAGITISRRPRRRANTSGQC